MLRIDPTTDRWRAIAGTRGRKQERTTLGVNSCIPANARSGLTLTSSANQDGGSVTWKLVRNAVTVGPNATVAFVMSSPPC